MSSKEEKPIDSAMETNNGNCDEAKIPQQQCANTDVSIGQSVENKTQEITKNTMIDSSSGQSSTELNDKLIEDLANESIPCEMEVTESRLETESVEIETVKSIEMKKLNSETVTEAVQISSQQKDTTEDSQQITDKSPQNEPVAQQIVEENKESIENESNMETQATEGKSKQEKSPANKSIGSLLGSLGLLNQYASSSDEDDDSSSDDDDGASADSESETDDDTGDSSNNEVLGTPAVKDKELTTMANGILNSVMSRQNYREASSDS